MGADQLVIVCDSKLMADHQRDIRQPWSFQAGAALVDVTNDEIVNWEALLRRLVKAINARVPADGPFPPSVVVVAHSHCFKGGPDEFRNQFHRRMPLAEQALGKALESKLGRLRSGQPRLYEFHHEPYEGSLWNALQKLPSGGEEALKVLMAALERTEAEGVFEQLSVVKHRIVGLFLPLDLRLQGGALENEVAASLEAKNVQARQLMADLRQILEGSGRRVEAERVDEVLLLLDEARPATQSAARFHAWVQELEQSLHQLRAESVLSCL